MVLRFISLFVPIRGGHLAQRELMVYGGGTSSKINTSERSYTMIGRGRGATEWMLFLAHPLIIIKVYCASPLVWKTKANCFELKKKNEMCVALGVHLSLLSALPKSSVVVQDDIVSQVC